MRALKCVFRGQDDFLKCSDGRHVRRSGCECDVVGEFVTMELCDESKPTCDQRISDHQIF